jgi:hypothetical protein
MSSLESALSGMLLMMMPIFSLILICVALNVESYPFVSYTRSEQIVLQASRTPRTSTSTYHLCYSAREKCSGQLIIFLDEHSKQSFTSS